MLQANCLTQRGVISTNTPFNPRPILAQKASFSIHSSFSHDSGNDMAPYIASQNGVAGTDAIRSDIITAQQLRDQPWQGPAHAHPTLTLSMDRACKLLDSVWPTVAQHSICRSLKASAVCCGFWQTGDERPRAHLNADAVLAEGRAMARAVEGLLKRIPLHEAALHAHASLATPCPLSADDSFNAQPAAANRLGLGSSRRTCDMQERSAW